MTPIGAVHTIFAFLAAGAGAVVLRLPKGTRWHRTFGHVYAMSMLGTVATALALYNLTGGFGPFHVAAIVGGMTIAAGLYTVLARKPRKSWIEAHASWMAWSYVGLMAAFVSETMTRFVMPRAAPHLEGSGALWGVFWSTVVIATLVVVFVGKRLIDRRLPGAIASAREAIRREHRALARAEDSSVEAVRTR